MNAKAWLAVSLGANVVAAVLLVWNFSSDKSHREETPQLKSPVAATPVQAMNASNTRHVVTAVDKTQTVSAFDGNTLPKIWGRVAVADYKQFVANLRAIGMPEETIRDIVMFDLLKSLGDHMTGLAQRTAKSFWQCRTYGPKSTEVTNEVRQAVTQFTGMSEEVLGTEPSVWFMSRFGWLETVMTGQDNSNFSGLEEIVSGLGNAQGWEWLPRDRLMGMEQLGAKYQKTLEELEARREAAKTDAEREAMDKEITGFNEEREKAQNEFLTAAERREKELRDDWPLKAQLANVDVSREEYERLHDLAKSCGATNAPLFHDGTPEQAQALNILGAERYAEFQRASDPKYGAMLNFCAGKDIPADSARKLYDIRSACLQSIQTGTDIMAARQQAQAAFATVISTGDLSSVSYFLPSVHPYAFQPGDTLETIAERNATSPEQILQASGLPPGSTPVAGQIIKVPRM